MTAKPMGPLARSEGYWAPLAGGAWRFAPGHPRLLLLVRFADSGAAKRRPGASLARQKIVRETARRAVCTKCPNPRVRFADRGGS